MALIVFSTEAKEEMAFHIISFLLSAACFFVAEDYKRKKHYRNAGTDNALVWAGLGWLVSNIFWLLSDSGLTDNQAMIIGCLITTIIFIIATLRYADIFVALCAFASGILFLFSLMQTMGNFGKAIIPFVGFLYAVGVYLYLRFKVSEDNKIFYHDCMALMEAAALIVAYLSVNYFVVRSFSEEMFDLDLTEGQDIPFGKLFMFLTIVLPPAYIYLALKFKNRVMLRMGLLLIAATIFTIRYYNSVLPIEIASILGGAFLIGGSYFLIRWLTVPKYGFSVQEEGENTGYRIAESLIVAQTFSQPAASQDTNQFGGGNYGGGGANENF